MDTPEKVPPISVDALNAMYACEDGVRWYRRHKKNKNWKKRLAQLHPGWYRWCHRRGFKGFNQYLDVVLTMVCHCRCGVRAFNECTELVRMERNVA